MAGRVFNIASGRAISVNVMLAALARLVGAETRARFEPPRPGDVRDSLADIEAARSSLGYEPRVSFEEGLERLVASGAGVAVAQRVGAATNGGGWVDDGD